MAHAWKVESEGHLPACLCTSDSGSAKLIPPGEAEGSQDWSEHRDESALPSTSDGQHLEPQSGGGKIGRSPEVKLPVALECREMDNGAVRETRNLLGNDLASSTPNSSSGTRDQTDDSPESLEEWGSDSSLSDISDDSDLNRLQVDAVGGQFQEGDGPILGLDEDSGLDATVTRQTIILYYGADI